MGNNQCPICGTAAEEGIACGVCGWEFLLESSSYYSERMEECREYAISKGHTVLIDEKVEESEHGEALAENIDEVVSGKVKIEDDVSLSGEENDEVEKPDDKTEKNSHQDNNHVVELVNESVERILGAFEKKLMYDKVKEGQIDKLHAELQEYKRDLLAKTNRPLINGIISMFDDMDKVITKVSEKPEDMTFEKMIKILSDVKEDIEILLEENGVTSFEEVGELFDPKRQQVAKKIATGDKGLVGRVVEHVRPGFETEGNLIKKERVSVYVFDESMVVLKDNQQDNQKTDADEKDNTTTNEKESENE